MQAVSHDKIKVKLSEILFSVITKLLPEIDIQEIYQSIVFPPDANFGHYAFPCFNLAKKMRAAPPKIAQQLAAEIQKDEVLELISPVGPYINFKVSGSFLGNNTCIPILEGTMFSRKLVESPLKTMIEYSQPNTHKELHVGHMRNICLGDALVRLHQYCGFDIISSTFPGDVGTHVAKCLWYYKYHNTEPAPAQQKGAWLGTLYSKGHLKLENEAETPTGNDNKKQLSQILSQLENKQGEFYDIWRETREWSIELMKEVYDWANVHFDRWYWESEVDKPSVEYVRNNIGNGIFINSEGTVGVDLSAFGLGFCMLLKSDGHGLYATKDVELARRKFEDFKIEKSIYVVDKRQAHHFAQVFKTLELLGFENAKNCYHLQYDYVELPDGAMSSRKGNIVPIMDLITQMDETVKTEYLNKNKGDWENDEIETTADIIAQGAIKYGMIKIDPMRKIVFDMKEWVKIDGDAGPYLQYTFARINSMLKKVEVELSSHPNWATMKEDAELNVMVKLSDFNNQVVAACLDYRPSLLCVYLYELCKTFNTFYNLLSIKKTEDETLKTTRLALSKCVAVTLKKGLSVLGIAVPERM